MTRTVLATTPHLDPDGMRLVTMCFVNDIGLKRFLKMLRKQDHRAFSACGFVGIDGEIDADRCQAAAQNVVEFCAANGWLQVE